LPLQTYAPHETLLMVTHLPAPLQVGAGVDEYVLVPEQVALPQEPVG